VDGLITFPTDKNEKLYKQILKEGLPLVFVDRLIKDVLVNSFLLDNENASYIAVNHLVEKGHQKIGMITTSLLRSVTLRVERIEGFKTAMKRHGITPQDNYIKGVEVTHIQFELSKMLSSEDPPTALFAGNDLTLMEVLSYIKKKNIKIPDELSLINIDDVSFSHIYDPTLTTIAQPASEIGQEAGNMLIKEIKDSSSVEKGNIYRFKANLIKRSST